MAPTVDTVFPTLSRPARMPTRQADNARSALLACLLALALLCSQSLGVAHAVLHGGVGGAVPVERHAHSPSPSSDGPVKGLFANHHSVSDCHAFDALTHAYALPAAQAACLAQASPPLPDLPVRHGRIAPQAAGFLARGPPSVLS